MTVLIMDNIENAACPLKVCADDGSLGTVVIVIHPRTLTLVNA